MPTDTNIDPDMLPRTFRQPPEAFHPDQINHADFASDLVLQQASNTLRFAYEGFPTVDELRPNRNPLDTPATHARKVARAADNLFNEWSRRWDSARAAIAAGIKSVDAQLDDAAGLKANPRFEAAVCARFAGMKPAERAKAVSDLIEAGDTASLATLIDAPSVTTGIAPDVRASIRERVLLAKAPQLLALREAYVKADAKLNNAGNRSLAVQRALLAGTDKHEARIKSAESVAAKVAV